MCVYTYDTHIIHMYICVYMYLYTHIIHMYICVYMYKYVYICIYYANTGICIRVHVRVHMYTQV